MNSTQRKFVSLVGIAIIAAWSNPVHTARGSGAAPPGNDWRRPEKTWIEPLDPNWDVPATPIKNVCHHCLESKPNTRCLAGSFLEVLSVRKLPAPAPTSCDDGCTCRLRVLHERLQRSRRYLDPGGLPLVRARPLRVEVRPVRDLPRVQQVPGRSRHPLRQVPRGTAAGEGTARITTARTTTARFTTARFTTARFTTARLRPRPRGARYLPRRRSIPLVKFAPGSPRTRPCV